MKIKTADLIGPALDWAAEIAEGVPLVLRHDYMKRKAKAYNFQGDMDWQLQAQDNDPMWEDEGGVTHDMGSPSTDWAQGGPIIEREKITVSYQSNAPLWVAMNGTGRVLPNMGGPTPLIAAMRCFVSSKLGDKVDVPEELK